MKTLLTLFLTCASLHCYSQGEWLQYRSCTCKSGNTNNGIDIWIKPLLPSGSPYRSCHWIGRSTIHIREWSSSLLSPLILHGSCL